MNEEDGMSIGLSLVTPGQRRVTSPSNPDKRGSEKKQGYDPEPVC